MFSVFLNKLFKTNIVLILALTKKLLQTQEHIVTADRSQRVDQQAHKDNYRIPRFLNALVSFQNIQEHQLNTIMLEHVGVTA